MKQFLKLFSIICVFGFSLIGYLCLPDMISMWRQGCTFVSVTDKTTVSRESNQTNLYTLDGNQMVWDRTDYKTGDLVCVKKHI
jgi:hypothetical protein